MLEKIKYPRTVHLPYSPGATKDDKKLSLKEWEILSSKLDGKLAVSEKMDGENTTFTSEYFHARSLDSRHHLSRDMAKSIWGGIRYSIPKDIRIHGENLFAKHSIYYDSLPSFFILFGITRGEYFLSVEETQNIAEELGLFCIPFTNEIPEISSFNSTGEREGYVYRNMEAFKIADFQENVFKFVREGHVQTDKHWMNQKLIQNKLV